MYNLYNRYLILSIQTLEIKQKEQRELIDSYLKELGKIRYNIMNFVDYSELLNGRVKELPEDLKNIIPNYKYNNIIVKNYYNLYRLLTVYETDINNLKTQQVKFKVYKDIIRKFNSKMLDYCAITGKPFENKYFGKLCVYFRPTPSNVINWGESNRKKQAIIDKGGIPYNGKDAEIALKEGREYLGEKWIDKHFDRGLLYWRWYSPTILKTEIKRELYNYKYIIAKGNFGALNAIKNVYNIPNHDYSVYINDTTSNI